MYIRCSIESLYSFIKKHTHILAILSCTLLTYAIRIFIFDGTGDDGDSLTHFLIAKNASTHTELFFDHWGKPVYTFLAFPFAHFGFKGIQCFNLLNLVFSQSLLYLIAKNLRFKFNWLPSLFLGFCLMSFKIVPSGLTEPLFANFLTFAILAYCAGHFGIAEYLQIPFVSGAGEVAIFMAATGAACLGFLWFNTYPAEVFMGDVGALSLGGALGIAAVITKNEFLLVICGGIFVVEAVSVMMQVGSFKMTGKRIFKMAPIHHHFELKGWAEPKVIVRFWIISIMLALVTLATLKLR